LGWGAHKYNSRMWSEWPFKRGGQVSSGKAVPTVAGALNQDAGVQRPPGVWGPKSFEDCFGNSTGGPPGTSGETGEENRTHNRTFCWLGQNDSYSGSVQGNVCGGKLTRNKFVKSRGSKNRITCCTGRWGPKERSHMVVRG